MLAVATGSRVSPAVTETRAWRTTPSSAAPVGRTTVPRSCWTAGTRSSSSGRRGPWTEGAGGRGCGPGSIPGNGPAPAVAAGMAAAMTTAAATADATRLADRLRDLPMAPLSGREEARRYRRSGRAGNARRAGSYAQPSDYMLMTEEARAPQARRSSSDGRAPRARGAPGHPGRRASRAAGTRSRACDGQPSPNRDSRIGRAP